MKKFFILIGVLLSTLIQAKDHINIAISSAPNNLNPFFSTDSNSQNINRLVHLSLIDFNSLMQFECVACSTFQERMVGTKHVIRFQLKNDLTFSDNSKVKSGDLYSSWQFFAKNQKIKSTFMGAFEAIEDVIVFDDLNFEIVFKEFSLENLSNLALLKLVKINKSDLEDLLPQDIIGAGDYVLSATEPLSVDLAPRKPGLPFFKFKVVKDETTLALKLINKEIDLSVASMSPRKVQFLKKTKGLTSWEIPSGNYQFLGMNHTKEIFQNKEFRQGLSHLIPRVDLLKYKFKDTAVISRGMFSPAFADMYEEKSFDDYNPARAKELFLKAGVVFKDNKFYFNNAPIEFDWKVSNNKASIEIAETLKYYFEKSGLKVNLTILEWGTFMSAFKSGKFDLIIGQWVGFTGPDMLKFVFHSSNVPPKGGNRIKYNNINFDKMVDAATIETDKIKRNELYKKAHEIVMNDYAYVNLWHPNVIWIGTDCLSNIQVGPTGSFMGFRKVKYECGK